MFFSQQTVISLSRHLRVNSACALLVPRWFTGRSIFSKLHDEPTRVRTIRHSTLKHAPAADYVAATGRDQSLHEVETKFIIKDFSECEKKLQWHGARALGRRNFVDEYYDMVGKNERVFRTNDWWLRKRDTSFELKVPSFLKRKTQENPNSKSRSTTMYKEISVESEILRYLRSNQHFGESFSQEWNQMNDILASGLLQCFARITTHRTSYQLDNFQIDLDQTDFGYCIGEVETSVVSSEEVLRAVKSVEEICQRLQLTECENHGAKHCLPRSKVSEYLLRGITTHLDRSL